jgi:hypothetical protein
MNPQDRRLWLDWQTSLYLEALEKQDFDAQEKLWDLAAHDADLEAAFHETHEAILEERSASTTEAITTAVEKLLTSAEIVRESTGPVMVSDVAEELFHRAGKALAADGYAWTEKRRASQLPLPEIKGLTKLAEWLESTFGPLPAGVGEAFQKAAFDVKFRRRAADAEYQLQLAARRAPKPEGGEG